ncbi:MULTISPECIES: hypothetical protein [Xenorhabdus]|uniref:Uncharacterized protein n=1 Tax=Xenorhabdus eapokensis TaxID=1873482 RepID=A0A1Q5TGT0_9GAMM|nr:MULTISPECIES: hypothetical protein [Xenorhabdus]MBC8949862.1 hypothetical protein [Xenorhabdus sp. TS4]OKO99422.1 hypothetical protein Xedl_03661 [Xenorhabdus eapokensis]
MSGERGIYALTNIFTCKSGYLSEDIQEGCIFNIECETVGNDCDTDEEVTISKSRFILVNSSHNGVLYDWNDLLDLEASTKPYMELFDVESNELSSAAFEAIGSPYDHFYPDDVTQLFIIDRIEIIPEYRGKKYAEIIIFDAIRIFAASSQLIALKPFPLKFEIPVDKWTRASEEEKEWHRRLGLEQFIPDEKLAFQRLCDYYKRLGFVDTGNGVFIMQNVGVY